MRFFPFLFLFPLWIFAQSATANDTIPKIKILFGGDLMSHGPQLKAAYIDSAGIYNYEENFLYLSSIFKSHDLSVINLETPLGVKPFSGYPAFSAPPSLVLAAKKAGINMFVTANNHACDKGKRGIIKTLDILDRLELEHTGTFRNQKEKDSLYPFITEKNGIKIAWLNYTYGTNGIPVPYPAKVNLIDRKQIAGDVAKAKSMNPDVIIAFLHWGTQYKNLPGDSQKSLSGYLRQLGVNYVIGSHPHVIQPVKWEKTQEGEENLRVYSLGNFLSNQRKFPRDGSMLVSVEFIKDSQGVSIDKLEIIPIWVYKYTEKGKRHYEILPVKDFIYKPSYFKENGDYQKMMRYYKHFLSFEFDKLGGE